MHHLTEMRRGCRACSSYGGGDKLEATPGRPPHRPPRLEHLDTESLGTQLCSWWLLSLAAAPLLFSKPATPSVVPRSASPQSLLECRLPGSAGMWPQNLHFVRPQGLWEELSHSTMLYGPHTHPITISTAGKFFPQAPSPSVVILSSAFCPQMLCEHVVIL